MFLECPTITTTKATDIMIHHILIIRVINLKNLPLENSEIEIIGATPALNRSFSKVGRAAIFSQAGQYYANFNIYHAFNLFLKILFIALFTVNI